MDNTFLYSVLKVTWTGLGQDLSKYQGEPQGEPQGQRLKTQKNKLTTCVMLVKALSEISHIKNGFVKNPSPGREITNLV